MYKATIRMPFHQPRTVDGANLRTLLREVRTAVVTGPHGTQARVETTGDDPFEVAVYQNKEGKLRKVR